MSTNDKSETVPAGSAAKNTLGNWISPDDLNKAVRDRFPGCMKGKRPLFVCTRSIDIFFLKVRGFVLAFLRLTASSWVCLSGPIAIGTRLSLVHSALVALLTTIYYYFFFIFINVIPFNAVSFLQCCGSKDFHAKFVLASFIKLPIP